MLVEVSCSCWLVDIYLFFVFILDLVDSSRIRLREVSIGDVFGLEKFDGYERV